ncbi:MAG: aldehyde dehydrogenase family protein [Bacteroidia bacterium]
MISAETFPFIANRFLKDAKGPELLVKDKFSQELIARVPQITEADAEAAIASSIQAFQELSQWTIDERIKLLRKIRELLKNRSEWFANLIVSEAGKPITYARSELKRCLKTIDSGIRELGNAHGEMVPMFGKNADSRIAFTKYFPTGPILGITPFNFPLNLALHKIIPALAVGTSIVLKAPPQCPLSLISLAALIAEAGAPAGSVNMIVCEISLAEQLVKDERFSVLSFTGSDRVGWYLKSIAGKKKVLLELGGNAPLIVDSSANLKDAAKQAANGAFIYAGQICISTQRIFVAEDIYETFKDLLLSETAHIRSGNPNDDNIINGPMINSDAVDRIADWTNEALKTGAELLAGGQVLDNSANLFAPTILSDVNPSIRIVTEEAFAPVAILEKVRNVEHAIKLANSGKYGLQCGIFTQDIELFKRAYHQLQYGAVILNSAPGFRMDHMPYGGIKSSGIGREGVKYAMQDFAEMKLAVI